MIYFILLLSATKVQAQMQVDTVRFYVDVSSKAVKVNEGIPAMTLMINGDCIEVLGMPQSVDFKNGNWTYLQLTLINQCHAERNISLSMPRGNFEFSGRDTFILPPTATQYCTIKFKSLEMYDHALDITASSGSFNTAIKIEGLAKTKYPIFGTIEHFSRQPPGRMMAEKDMSVLSELPCQVFRVDGPGTWVFQNSPDSYYWNEADWQVDRIRELGAKVVMLCGYVPAWAKFDPHSYTDEELKTFLKQYANYLNDLTRRYAGRVDYWEPWNEPELFWFDKKIGPKEVEVLYQIIKVASEIIRKEDPTSMILTPGFTPDVINCSGPGFDLFEALQRKGMMALVDAVCVHNYPGAYPPAYAESTGPGAYLNWLKDIENHASLEQFNEYMAKNQINKPVWFSECGIPYKKGYEKEAVLGFARMLAINAFEGVQGLIQYETYDYPHDSHPPDFSLTDSNHKGMTGMFLGYREMIKALTGSAPAVDALQCRELDGQTALKYRTFKRGTEIILISWNDDPVPVVIEFSQGSVARNISVKEISMSSDKNFIEHKKITSQNPYVRMAPGDLSIVTIEN